MLLVHQHARTLSNDDFRNFIKKASTAKPAAAATPKPAGKAGAGKKWKRPGKGRGEGSDEEDDEAHQQSKSAAKVLSDKYRDRAAERRKTSNLHETDPLLQLELQDHKQGVFEAANKDERLATIERSKYLGGDMAHTHLVKGLDYALLQKQREDEKKRQETEGLGHEQMGEDVAITQPPAALVTSSLPPVARKVIDEAPSKVKPVTFRTRMAKGVYDALFHRPERGKRNEMFEPGRMAFVVELDSTNQEDTDIPTTLLRSKAQCESHALQRVTAAAATHDIVMNKLIQIISYIRQGSRQVKKRKKEAPIKSALTPKPVPEAENDFDIFGGGNGSESGVPMDTRADVPVRLPVGDGKSYFGSHTATEELSTMGGTAAGPLNEADRRKFVKTVLNQYAGQEPRGKRKEVLPESYGEYYPGDAYDSGDDIMTTQEPEAEDISKKRKRKKKVGIEEGSSEAPEPAAKKPK